MQTAALNYKLIKKIKDDRFDEDKIHLYDLLINVGSRDIQVGVIDESEHRIILLEDYVLPTLSSNDELMKLLEQLYDAHPFLKAAFWKKIKISIKNNKFIQVPDALYIDQSRAEYLRYNAQVHDDEDCLVVRNNRAGAQTIFAVNKRLKEWFNSIYTNNQPLYMHQSATLIEGILNYAEHKKDDCLYIYVDRFKLHIVSLDNGKLQYYNQFTIKHFPDYIKYIMLVMKSLGRDQQTSKVMLWGYIGKNSPHYNEFYKYIKNVVFGERVKYLKFGYMFDEVQDHHFFDLYSMHLLGS